MTEKEKQQAGELYNSNDRQLLAERVAADSRDNFLVCGDCDIIICCRNDNTYKYVKLR
ncbi:MAG: hypothetical protein GXY08_12545 [Ruminococcus sp.]|nr:hypothetical protein [Ruminococcus sp.]